MDTLSAIFRPIYFFCLLILITFFGSCSSSWAQNRNEEFESWKKSRIQELTGEEGWLNLVGLIPMDTSTTYLNSMDKDSLVLKSEFNESTLGKFLFANDSVWFTWKNREILSQDSVLVFPTAYGSAAGLYYKDWKWSVIKRGEVYFLRLRKLNHPDLENFEATPVFDYNSNYRVSAFFLPKFNQVISIPNVLGQVIPWKVMGELQFVFHGKSQRLIALEEAGKLFIIFSDQSSGQTTYPTGRYLYVNYPNAKGETILDFNFAYNPPCAYTAYATCPIPPKENRLDFLINAGEKVPALAKNKRKK
ncbi:MAG: DUF1684 domain-containing protein [Bacteroidota bacterium]|jgi:uncharacterized protein (DUF1684 family)|nr:DUF1684 domain-containing protein [Algoriphagus sp.]